MKNILIISSSPRKNGNSDTLCNEFAKGAKESGNNVEKIFLADKKINFCTACENCYNIGKCVQKDDANDIIEKIIKSDIIVLSTPTYFYNMSGQLKTLIDRTCGVYESIKNKEFYFIVSAADGNEKSLDRVVDALEGFTICLPNSKIKDTIKASGVWKIGDVNNTAFTKKAYEIGKNII